MRPHVHATRAVAPGNAAAAHADLDDRHHWQLHRLAGGITTDVIALFDTGHAVGDQCGFGGGTAHVEADSLFNAQQPSHETRPDHAGDRT